MSQAQAARLRAALLDPVAAERIEVAGSSAAAVLAPLFERDGELHAVFTKRRSHLRLHAGQISFPGGRPEHGDADLVQTALREAHEEIGLDPATVTLVGALRPTPTVVTDIAIYPVVGLIPPPATPWTVARSCWRIATSAACASLRVSTAPMVRACVAAWALARAVMAAYWLMVDGLLVSWLWTLPIALMTWTGPIAQPMRQPVMA